MQTFFFEMQTFYVKMSYSSFYNQILKLYNQHDLFKKKNSNFNKD